MRPAIWIMIYTVRLLFYRRDARATLVCKLDWSIGRASVLAKNLVYMRMHA